MLRKAISTSTIVITLALVGVIVSQTACGDVGKKIVSGADRADRTVEQLREDQLISKDEADQMQPLIADVRKLGEEYAAIEQAIKSTSDESEKESKREQLRGVGRQVTASLKRLDREGVLRVKNEGARRRLQQGLAIASIVANLIT